MGKTRISKAYEILKDYNGSNNQILYYQKLHQNGKLILEDFGVQYILKNYDYEPFEVNKVFDISIELGEELQKKNELEFTPKKIKIGKVIGEMGGSYHCYAQYRQSVPMKLMYLPKKYILGRLKTVDPNSVVVDFDVYDNMPSANGRKLKEHQKSGVKFLIANKKCILADGMGTGKTVTSIIAALAGGFKNILVITTASLKTNWKKDLVLYVPEEDINIVSGSKWTPGQKFTVINYDIIDNFYEVPLEPVYETEYVYKQDGTVAEEFQVPVMVKDKNTGKMVQKMQKSRKKEDINEALMNSPLFLEDYDCVIIDEAQKLSNHDSNRYQCISDFLRKSSPAAIFLLTGTPLTNNPMNLYNILRLIDAEVTWNPKFYKIRYCGAKEMTLRTGKKILKPGQPTHLNELREKIKDVYIRRLASETGEMVNKSVERRYFDLTPEERAQYNQLWNDYLKAQEETVVLDNKYKEYWNDEEIVDDKEKYRQLIEGGLIRQFLGRTMVQHTIKAVDEYLEDGEKVVIITVYNKEMEMLKNYYGNKCVVYNGKMLPKQKDKAQDKFLNDPKVKVFIGQVIACGVGLSLPVANKLIFNNFSFVNADNEQAEDRIYRLTQTNDVTCTYMLFNDSYAQEMFDKVLFKKQLSDTLIRSEQNKKKK